MPRAVILGCAGERLNADERRFFGDADPVGFILFRRNCRSPDQVRDLVAALRDSIETPSTGALGTVLEHPVVGDVARFALSSDATALRHRLGSIWTR